MVFEVEAPESERATIPRSTPLLGFGRGLPLAFIDSAGAMLASVRDGDDPAVLDIEDRELAGRVTG
jgi:hypothetical protein